MITAHLPSGYVTGRLFGASRACFWAAFLGAILPDFDLIWFYFVDNRALHHHNYWVHIPAFWLLMASLVLPATRWLKPSWIRPAMAFFAGILVHLLLDTIAGDVKWLWPLSDRFFHLFTVPATYENWILNFVLHPVFLLEILIWVVALGLWWRNRVTRDSAQA
ncbi:MAG: metal-dependent hydrolase [Pseudomonadota bacterium]